MLSLRGYRIPRMKPGSLLLRLLLSMALVGNGLLPATSGMRHARAETEPVAKIETAIEQAGTGHCHGSAPESSAPAPKPMPAHPHAAQDAGKHSMPCCPDNDMAADCNCDCLHVSAIALAAFEFIGAAAPVVQAAAVALVAADDGPAETPLRPPISLA